MRAKDNEVKKTWEAVAQEGPAGAIVRSRQVRWTQGGTEQILRELGNELRGGFYQNGTYRMCSRGCLKGL